MRSPLPRRADSPRRPRFRLNQPSERECERTFGSFLDLIHQRGESRVGQDVRPECSGHAHAGRLLDDQTEEHVVGVLIDEVVARCRPIRRNGGEELLGCPRALRILHDRGVGNTGSGIPLSMESRFSMVAPLVSKWKPGGRCCRNGVAQSQLALFGQPHDLSGDDRLRDAGDREL